MGTGIKAYAANRMLFQGIFAVVCRPGVNLMGGHKVKMPTGKDVLVGRFSVGVTGFEPATPCSQSRCTTGLRHTPFPRTPEVVQSITFASLVQVRSKEASISAFLSLRI